MSTAMRFVLTIRIGNDAMSDEVDVCAAIRVCIAQVTDRGCPGLGKGGYLKDDNGNTIGEWEYESVDPP